MARRKAVDPLGLFDSSDDAQPHQPAGRRAKDFFHEQGPQSAIKAEIVRKYFLSWARISVKRAGRILYMDLYAGPGKYDDGTPSTPLLVLKQIIDNPELHDKVVTFFSDKDKGAIEKLKGAVAKLPGIEQLKFPPVIQSGQVTKQISDDLTRLSLVPTFMFLDPFGYKGISADLIGSALSNPGSECVFFFNYNRVAPGLVNDKVRGHVDALFGAPRVEQLKNLVSTLGVAGSEAATMQALRESMKECGGAYIQPFRFRKNGRTTHYLIFVGAHALGHKIMKDVMGSFSTHAYQDVPSFEYVQGRDPGIELFTPTPIDDLKAELLTVFSGESLTVQQVFDKHNLGTNYVMRNYKEAIKQLMREGTIPEGVRTETHKPVLKHPYNTMPEDVQITFPRR